MNSYITLNNTKTRVVTFGNPFECDGSEVIVVIPGSPGIPEFYTEFACELHRRTELPVCVVGHAGHDVIRTTCDDVNLLSSNLFNIEGQVKHKLDLINNHIDETSRIHVIGHSIGAWLLMEMLNKNDHIIRRISSVNLLFPTLQHFAETKNGSRVNNIVRRLHSFVLLLFTITQIVPFITLFITKLYLIFNSLPSYYVDRISIYLKPEIQAKSMLLAYECLDTIKELNEDVMNKVRQMTNVVYSTYDGWVPMHHVKNFKKFEPHTKVEEVNVEHVFVLKSSVLVGKTVAGFINSRSKLNNNK